MGLDMYVYKCKPEEITQPTDFHFGYGTHEEFFYWRKHPNLHGWMEQLYRKKGGQDEMFNGATLQLTMADICALEDDIKNRCLPNTSGFFFGRSDGSEYDDDLKFIQKAKQALEKGFALYYDSSW